MCHANAARTTICSSVTCCKGSCTKVAICMILARQNPEQRTLLGASPPTQASSGTWCLLLMTFMLLLMLLPRRRTQPLGVLHDLLTPTSTTSAASSAGQSAGPTSTETPSCSFSSPSIPWSLTVHYQNMPAALQNNWQNAGAAKDHYFSSLKVLPMKLQSAAAITEPQMVLAALACWSSAQRTALM